MNHSMTVAEILQKEPLSRGRLAAGQSGLSAVVSGVTVLEVSWIEIPEGQVFFQKGDLVISSMYSVMENVDDQIRTVRLLHKQNCSALVLCHVGMVIKELSPKLIQACDLIGLPLIVMPTNIGYQSIITTVTDEVLARTNRTLNRKMEIYDSIMNMLIEKQDNSSIIRKLGEILECPVLYFNDTLKAEESAGLAAEHIDFIREQIRKKILAFAESYEKIEAKGWEEDQTLLFYPLYSNIFYYGVIVIIPNRELSEVDETAVLQIKNALYITHLNKNDAFEHRARLLTEYIDDLVHGYSLHEQIILNRSAALKHNIGNTHAVIVVDIYGFRKVAERSEETKIQNLKREFSDHMDHLLRTLSPDSIGCNISDKYVILFSENLQGDKLRDRVCYIGNEIRKHLKKVLDLESSVGIGSYCVKAQDIKESYQNALSAIHISNRIYGAPRLSFYDEFPVYNFMNRNIPGGMRDELKKLEDEMLGPLRAFDARSNGCLEETFLTLLECDMDTNMVAQKMYIHKNTVLQRKKKIAELLPRDPFAITNRLQYQILRMMIELHREDS